MDLMKIYNSSPIIVQNLMTTVQGWLYKRERCGEEYGRALEEYLSFQTDDISVVEDYQWKRAEELIKYAYDNSPFYKKFYEGIDLDLVCSSRDITMLPILEKEIVRQNVAEMYTVKEADGIGSNTSGTTGKSIHFIYRRDDMQRRMAYLDAFKMAHGYTPMKMKRASFGSSKIVPPTQKKKIFWRDNLAIKQRIYSGYHCKGENVKYYVENLNKFKPESLDGYPSALFELANYINTNGIKLSFTPIAIFPTAETLLPHYKKAIEEAFGCPVRDQYASSEGAPFITECSSGKLHYCMNTGLIEFFDDGRMLVTGFETHGTPLIRYDIGDRAYLADKTECSCGNCMPVVERIEGRTMDYIESPKNGRFTSIYLSLVSAEFNNCMKAMQFVQNDVNSVDVNIVTDDNYRPEMDKIIIDKLHYSLGEEVEVRVHKVDELIREPSGKVRFIINNVSKR